jgi:hypothetical protein
MFRTLLVQDLQVPTLPRNEGQGKSCPYAEMNAMGGAKNTLANRGQFGSMYVLIRRAPTPLFCVSMRNTGLTTNRIRKY